MTKIERELRTFLIDQYEMTCIYNPEMLSNEGIYCEI